MVGGGTLMTEGRCGKTQPTVDSTLPRQVGLGCVGNSAAYEQSEGRKQNCSMVSALRLLP